MKQVSRRAVFNDKQIVVFRETSAQNLACFSFKYADVFYLVHLKTHWWSWSKKELHNFYLFTEAIYFTFQSTFEHHLSVLVS